MIYAVFYMLAYALLAGFFLMECFVRCGKDTKNMNRTKHDKGSTTLISLAMGIAFIIIPLSPLFNYLDFGVVFNIWIGAAGILFGISGLFIRYFAFTTLGRFFSRILREADAHNLVTNGIYQYIRHPGYLSDILIFIGGSLAMGNLLPIVAVPVLFAIAYAYRIHVEEKMLIGIFGEAYRAYQKRSKRLIPFIY